MKTTTFWLVVFLLALAASVAACSSEALRRSDATPSPAVATPQPAAPTPPSPPLATPTASPTPAPVLRSTGWLVYLRDADLYVGALDGSGEQRLTTDGLSVNYSGYVRDGAATWLYYTRLAGARMAGSPPGPTGGTYKLFRTRLGDSGSEEEVLSFNGDQLDRAHLAGMAAISPDARRVAYTDEAGLHVREIASGADRLLLRSGACQLTPPIDLSTCRGYQRPVWSPDGRWLVADRVFYEGAVNVLLRPLEADPSPDELTVGGTFASWSPAGDQLCLSDNGMQPTGAGLVNLADRVYRSLTDDLPLTPVAGSDRWRVLPTSCVWDDHGRLAIGYQVGIDPASWRVTIVRVRGGIEIQADFGLPPPYQAVVSWLPDGSGMIVSRYALCVPCGEREPASAVLLPDGTTRSLPFAPGRILALVPEPPPPEAGR